MSNCVEIKNDVILSPDMFDCERLLADVEAHKDVKQSFDRPWKEQIFYWYLTPDNVYKDGDDTILALGQGRSGHTWRDLRVTGMVLSEYAKIENVCLPLLMSDEYDGFEEEFRYEMILEKP